MAANSKSLTNSFKKYLEEVARVTCKEAADVITTDLKTKGPYWTGEFEESWVVKPGDVAITPKKPSSFTKQQKLEGWAVGQFPAPRRVTPVDIPEPQVQKSSAKLTIGNEMDYQGIAADLLPGRYETDKANTADKDWFIKYQMANGAKKALQEATKRAANSPSIKNFKG